MTEDARILVVKNAARARLFGIPGVHAIGVGPKFVGGKRTAELSISVFVFQKRPPGELAPEHVIPPEIDGVRTDVVERAPPRLLAGPALPDTKTYRPLTGGIRIKQGGALGGGGTLGCFAKTNGASPRVVGITCWHVVAEPSLDPTGLVIKPVADAWEVSGTNTPATQIVVEFLLHTVPHSAGAMFTTAGTETAATIAAGVAQAVNDMGLTGISAAPSGDGFTVTVPSGISAPSVLVYGPRKSDPKAKLHASVASPTTLSHVITITGQPGDGQGLFTTIHPGGTRGVFGVFTAPGKNLAIGGIKTKLADQIRAIVTEKALTGITVTTAVPGIVTVSGVQAVTCEITNDIRVGQPDSRFGCSTSWCTNNRIGKVLDARPDVDAALIEIDPGLKYLAEIQDLGVVKGFYVVNGDDVFDSIDPDGTHHHREYPVKKRGMTTGATEGAILRLHVDGFIPLGTDSPFGGEYQDAMEIVSGLDAFADSGDSGSAVVAGPDAAEEGKVVGILFAAGFGLLGSNFAMATPIKNVTDALNVTLEIATAAEAGVARTVPKPVGVAMTALDEEELALGPPSMAGHPSAALRERLAVVGQEVAASPVGEEIAAAVQRHIPETQDLINGHRRVGAVWRRNGGTRIIQGFLEMVQASPERALTLPDVINGRPLAECFRRIHSVLLRYGSETFGADLRRLGPLVLASAGLTYPQMLETLAAMSARADLVATGAG